MSETARIDKWLWSARIYKTRSIAVDAIKNGRVTMDGVTVETAILPCGRWHVRRHVIHAERRLEAAEGAFADKIEVSGQADGSRAYPFGTIQQAADIALVNDELGF